MNKQRKIIVISISLFIILVLLDFSPIVYYKIFPHKGSWPNFYTYKNTKPDKLLTSVENLGNDKLSVNLVKDTNDHSSYIRVVFIDKSNNDHYHSWVSTDTTYDTKSTLIVFGYIDKSMNYESGKRINTDYDFLTNYFIKRQFENLVIKKLDIKG